MPLNKIHVQITGLVVSTLMISSCMVGPNFHSPAPPQVQRYTETPLPKKTVRIPSAGEAGKAQTFVANKDIPVQWWILFHSTELNRLIDIGIAHSPNLAAAYAALRQAQEALNAQVGNNLLPAFNANFPVQRERFNASEFGTAGQATIFNLFNPNISVSYSLDVFGAARRQVESYQAQVDYQQFELIAAYLTLTSNIATTAINISSLDAQIRATKSLIKLEQNQLNIIKQQFRLGAISKATVLTQQTLVEQTRATLPPLEKNLSISQHTLSVLVGAFPEGQIPIIKLETLTLPVKLPVSLPSNLVRQRPDVRASEALLHSASALIGVATANLFPQFSVTGNYGWEALVPSALFGTSTKVWTIAGQITQPLFHGGALLAQRRQAIAAYDQAFAQYKQTVLQAFQNVADSLRAIETDARAFRAQRDAELAAQGSLKLTQDQYRLGGVSFLSLLIAEQQYQTTKISRIQAQAARYSDTAALFQALGGGWWNKNWCVKECGKQQELFRYL